AENMYAFNPNLKLIAVLREPAERAFSNYLDLVHRGVIDDIDFLEGLKRREDIEGMGYYYKQLMRYYALFPQTHIKVMLFDDLKRDNKGFLREIEDFLGVREYFPENISAASNVTGAPRWPTANKAITKMRYLLRSRNMNWVTTFLRRSGLAWLSMKLMHANVRPFEDKPKLSSAAKAALKQAYKEDTEKLETLIQRDLSAWKQE
ncbi:MAG: sulfotransferase domain-containing protein, partial [Anaerolineae bacterium]|nr:sulfotransferase domain-containing protein [Anaerolineae bacterium]